MSSTASPTHQPSSKYLSPSHQPHYAQSPHPNTPKSVTISPINSPRSPVSVHENDSVGIQNRTFNHFASKPILASPPPIQQKSRRFLSKALSSTPTDKLSVPYNLFASLLHRIDQLESQYAILERRVAKGSGKQKHQQHSLEQLYLGQQHQQLQQQQAVLPEHNEHYEGLRTQMTEMYGKMVRMEAEVARVTKEMDEMKGSIRKVTDLVEDMRDEKEGTAQKNTGPQGLLQSLGLTQRAQDFMSGLEMSSLIEHLQNEWTRDLEKMRIDLRKEFSVMSRKASGFGEESSVSRVKVGDNKETSSMSKIEKQATSSRFSTNSSNDKHQEEQWKIKTLQNELQKVQQELSQLNASKRSTPNARSLDEGTDSVPMRENASQRVNQGMDERTSRHNLTHMPTSKPHHLPEEAIYYSDEDQHPPAPRFHQQNGAERPNPLDPREFFHPSNTSQPDFRLTVPPSVMSSMRGSSPPHRRAPPHQHPSPTSLGHENGAGLGPGGAFNSPPHIMMQSPQFQGHPAAHAFAPMIQVPNPMARSSNRGPIYVTEDLMSPLQSPTLRHPSNPRRRPSQQQQQQRRNTTGQRTRR